MSITDQKKQELMQEFAIHENDVGSPEVQVAVLTHRIRNLTEHMKLHKKDFHTKRGLLVLVEKRRHLLKYLKNVEEARYQSLIKRLDLRK